LVQETLPSLSYETKDTFFLRFACEFGNAVILSGQLRSVRIQFGDGEALMSAQENVILEYKDIAIQQIDFILSVQAGYLCTAAT